MTVTTAINRPYLLVHAVFTSRVLFHKQDFELSYSRIRANLTDDIRHVLQSYPANVSSIYGEALILVKFHLVPLLHFTVTHH